MDEKEKRSLSVYLIALVLILANLVVLSVIYQVPFLAGLPQVKRALTFFSMAAVYPQDLFQAYLPLDLTVHFYWILCVMIAGFGLLLFNKFSRTIFIVFNILHFVVLSTIVVFNFGRGTFWDYFFKWYFNMVVFLIYVGTLTLPEIKAQFVAPGKESRFKLWFLGIRRKTLGPKDAQGFFNLGLAYDRLGRVDEAVSFLRRAADISTTKVEYHFELGRLLFDLGEYGPAIKELKDTVTIDPLHGRGRYLLGVAYEKTGCAEEAVQTFRRASFLTPQKAEVFSHLGRAAYERGYWEEARQALAKACDLDRSDPFSYYYLGLIAMKDNKDLKKAEEFFVRASRLGPEKLDIYNELGQVYVQTGDYRAAVRAFRDVLRLDADHKQAHYQLGFSYAMMEDFNSARREYRYLKEIDPDLAQTLAWVLK